MVYYYFYYSSYYLERKKKTKKKKEIIIHQSLKYNQNLTTGSILIEMGGHANSIEQAQYAGELVGKSLATALGKIKEEE